MKEILKDLIVGSNWFPILEQTVGSFRTFKLPIDVEWRMANDSESISTKEGVVVATEDDVVLTGPLGESWLVPFRRFNRDYDVKEGENLASKKYKEVYLFKMQSPFKVITDVGHVLEGKAGDYLAQFEKNDYGVVDSEIFDKTYEKL